MSHGSAIRLSSLRYRAPSARRRASSTASSVNGETPTDLQLVKDLARQLLPLVSKKVDDPAVKDQVSSLRQHLLLLPPGSVAQLSSWVSTQCGGVNGYRPDTVGAFLCGCFTGNGDCTANCLASPFTSGDCTETVMHWTTDSNGQPQSKLLNRGNGDCMVYVDPGFTMPLTDQHRSLAEQGCRSVKYFNSITNAQLLSADGMGGSAYAAVVQTASPIPVFPGTGPVPLNNIQPSKGQSGWWWIIALVVLLILILLVVGIAVWSRRRSGIYRY